MSGEDLLLVLLRAAEYLEKCPEAAKELLEKRTSRSSGEAHERVDEQVKGDRGAVKSSKKRSLEEDEREAKLKRPATKKAKQQKSVMYDEPVDPSSAKWEFLFSKVLTPSDVNDSSRELNRLIIPQKSMHLLEGRHDELTHKDYVDLVDQKGRVWSFVYKTKHGASLSANWVKFLREHDLKTKDEVSFYSRVENGRKKYGIALARGS